MFLLTDDYSRYSWVYFMQMKSETLERFKVFKQLQERQLGLPLKALRTDRGGEFLSREFIRYCETHGILHQLTAPYTPEHNGVAERKNRTVVEMARSMLHEMNLPLNLWVEATAAAVLILNRSPTKAVKVQTPFEALKGVKPSVGHLRVFGCVGHVFIDSHLRQKLDSKTKRCAFIGYCEDTKAYKMLDPSTGKVSINRNVSFF